MKYNGVIQKKLSMLDDHIRRLQRRMSSVTIEEFRDDWVLRAMAERMVQVCAEIMIDVAERIISLEQAGPVESAAAAIVKLHDLGVLASPDPYRNMVRMRNLIVHEYDSIDPAILYDAVTQHTSDFLSFKAEIDAASE
ncbi:MAG: type VII toxin-antitoxin system HepT family RNase toxin [Spirochaetota bacterium]